MAFISNQNRLKMAEKERKQKLSFRFVLTRCVIENCKKNSNKIQKRNKQHYDFFRSQNRLEKADKERKQKSSFSFVPIRRVIENSKKIAKKFKKLRNTITASFQTKIGQKRL